MISIARKYLVSSLFILLLLSTFTFYHQTKNQTQRTTIRSKKFSNVNVSISNVKDDISCHSITEDDALPSVTNANFSPPDNSIFFHETSCRKWLNSRQACAIESAAKAHPEKKIYVLFNGPISENIFYYIRSSIFELKKYSNIEFARVHVEDYVKGTAIEHLFKNGMINESRWKVVHTSDLLRVITMYKYGGFYLDTDIIVVKPMDSLGRNWLAKGSEDEITTAAMNMAKDELGQRFMKNILEEISRSYWPGGWLYNGPEAFHRVLYKFCNATKAKEFSKAACQGLEVYDPEVIYPVSYPRYNLLFLPHTNLMNTAKAYTFHLWNYLSHNVEVRMESPVEHLAIKYCPVIYRLYGESFGY